MAVKVLSGMPFHGKPTVGDDRSLICRTCFLGRPLSLDAFDVFWLQIAAAL